MINDVSIVKMWSYIQFVHLVQHSACNIPGHKSYNTYCFPGIDNLFYYMAVKISFRVKYHAKMFLFIFSNDFRPIEIYKWMS